MLRTSERTTLKKCEWLWDRTYNDKLKPFTDAPALRFGSLVHRALAAWYVPGVKRGEHPATAFEAAYEADMAANEEIFGMRVGNGDVEEKWENARELGIAMMNNYVDEYGADDRYEVLATEMPFKVLVTHEVRDPDAVGGSRVVPWFYYTGVIDGLWRDRRDKKIWIPDHKTTSGIGDKNWSHLVLDDQAGAYWSYGVQFLRDAARLGPRQRLAGMLYNIMRKAMPDERPSQFVKGKRMYLNKDGSVSQKQPSPYFARKPIFRDEFDRNEVMRRAEIDYRRIELFRSGELPLTKNPGMFTCPMCAMRDACELHETGNDWLAFLSQTTQAWDPYSEHEVYEGR
jgi:hypothetical protein